MKRTVALVATAVFAVNALTACGSSTMELPILDTQSTVQQDVQANSFSGVYKEIKNSSGLAFKELDKNADKMIAPDEYGVATPDSAKAFYAIDDNHDGKITLKEFQPGFFSRVGLTFRLRTAARALFKQLDKSKDKYVSKDELTSALVSTAFVAEFDKFDKEKNGLFSKNQKGRLSASEFENLFANIAMSNLTNLPAEPAPAPADPAPAPADPAPAPAKKK